MADQGSIANLKQNINENIYDNTDHDITGGRMNTVLQNIVDTLEFNGRDFFNVNEYREKSDAYADAAAGRAAVPDEVKKIGLVITYLLADGWYINQFIGSNISGWGTESNWKVIGPIRVSQNTQTLEIGGSPTAITESYVLNVNQINSTNGEPHTPYSDPPYNSINVRYKKLGLIIIFELTDGWHIQQYVGSDLVYANWINPENWVEIKTNISELLAQITHIGYVDSSLYGIINGIISSAGKWIQYQSYRSKIIPVAPNFRYIFKTSTYVGVVTFLKDLPVLNEDVEFAEGYTGVVDIPANSSTPIVSPADAKYLYLMYRNNNGEIVFPESVNVEGLEIPVEVNNSALDFSVSDTNGNEILGIYDGQIKTKNFDSSKAVITRKRPYSANTIRFEVPVNVNMLKNSQDVGTVEDSYVGNYKDKGILILPESYTPTGKPTRLIISFHGAGGGVTDTDSQTENTAATKYFVANGFAVMDMNGMPTEWVETWYNDCPNPDYKEYVKVNNMGCPLAMECYLKGLQWVMENYNIAKDGILVSGGSMGGLSSSNFVLMGGVPVLAHAITAPVLDTYNQPFLHPWTPIANPIISYYAISKLYNFTQEDGQYVYDASKVVGYNPIINGMQTFDENGIRISSDGLFDFATGKLNNHTIVEYKTYPCPLKIWHCDNDLTVNQSVSIRHINAIRRGGGKAWLRRFPTGGHEPTTTGTPVANPTGNTTFKGTSIGNIYPCVEEMFLFFKRFSN